MSINSSQDPSAQRFDPFNPLESFSDSVSENQEASLAAPASSIAEGSIKVTIGKNDYTITTGERSLTKGEKAARFAKAFFGTILTGGLALFSVGFRKGVKFWGKLEHHQVWEGKDKVDKMTKQCNKIGLDAFRNAGTIPKEWKIATKDLAKPYPEQESGSGCSDTQRARENGRPMFRVFQDLKAIRLTDKAAQKAVHEGKLSHQIAENRKGDPVVQFQEFALKQLAPSGNSFAAWKSLMENKEFFDDILGSLAIMEKSPDNAKFDGYIKSLAEHLENHFERGGIQTGGHQATAIRTILDDYCEHRGLGPKKQTPNSGYSSDTSASPSSSPPKPSPAEQVKQEAASENDIFLDEAVENKQQSDEEQKSSTDTSASPLPIPPRSPKPSPDEQVKQGLASANLASLDEAVKKERQSDEKRMTRSRLISEFDFGSSLPKKILERSPDLASQIQRKNQEAKTKEKQSRRLEEFDPGKRGPERIKNAEMAGGAQPTKKGADSERLDNQDNPETKTLPQLKALHAKLKFQKANAKQEELEGIQNAIEETKKMINDLEKQK